MAKITVNVPNGISIDAAEIAGRFRSLADVLDQAAENQRRIAEAGDPATKLTLQISLFHSLQEVANLTDSAVRATDVLRLLKSLIGQADLSPERLLQ
jgi:hypothetical protein